MFSDLNERLLDTENMSQKILPQYERRVVQRQRVYSGVVKLDRYQVIKQLGKGTFGIVYKGIQKDSGRYVAIKHMLPLKEQDGFPLTSFREIAILRDLNQYKCRNIIDLVELIYDRPPPDENYQNYDSLRAPKHLPKDFYMVFPFMSFDLSGILANPQIHLTEPDIKSIMYQLLNGISHIHTHHYLHRDIKSANILIDAHGVLKIGDFGLARIYNGSISNDNAPGGGVDNLTALVMTRWYRAPEVLFGDRFYTTAVDLWGIGCVFGELYERKPILRGTSDLQQAYDIFKLIGEPNENSMPNLEKYRFKEKEIVITPTKGNLIQRFNKFIPPDGLNLLSQLLTLDPSKRITASKALTHEFFANDPKPTENVTIKFEECHESDIKRFKEEQKNQRNNNKNFAGADPSLPPIPSMNQVGAISANGITKPKTQFFSSSNNYGQRYAPPTDVETPPGAPSHPAPVGPAQCQNNNNHGDQGYRYGANNFPRQQGFRQRYPDQYPQPMQQPPPSRQSTAQQRQQQQHIDAKRKYGRLENDRSKQNYDSPNGFGYNNGGGYVRNPQQPVQQPTRPMYVERQRDSNYKTREEAHRMERKKPKIDYKALPY